MTLKLIDAYESVDGITVVIDLDAGNPEPPDEDRRYTLVWGSYASSKNAGETKAQYLARLRDETRGLARLEAVKRGFNVPAKTQIAALIGVDIT